jgi:hypothetical protein
MIDSKPYISRADAEAMVWMNENLPPDAYVLASPFAFPWDSPPYAIQGSDAGLWIPLLVGRQASVPPIPAYNERLLDPEYLDKIREIVGAEPFEGQPANWDALRAAVPPNLDPTIAPRPGITHIYVGSRGGALDIPALLNDPEVDLVYHNDSVWLFALR